MLKKFCDKYFNLPEDFFTVENKYMVVGSLFGLGYIKKAPGTAASLVTLIIVLLLAQVSNNLVVIVTTLSVIVGLFVAEKISTPENPDPQEFVLDEFVGQSIALLLVAHNLILAIISFAVFRLLDIKKPWIIGQSETHFKGGLAIMMDDILAGFIALLLTLVVSFFLL